MSAAKAHNISTLIRTATDYLSVKGIENARLNAERLIGAALGFDRVTLYLSFDRPVHADELAAVRALLQRRSQHEPLQYIIGETEFMSLPLAVNPGVLIPRPETEVLVEAVVARVQSAEKQGRISILDVGTGSGCIAVSLAHQLPESQVMAVDISDSALSTARENAKNVGVSGRVKFAKANIFRIDTLGFESQGRFDVIASNPPYISQDEFALLPEEVKAFEPAVALCDGGDGLSFYRQIAKSVPSMLAADGLLAFEIGATQAEPVRRIVQDYLPKSEVRQDLAGRDRVVLAWG